MLDFLIAIDVILAVLIIVSVFLHQGSDGFMGDATPPVTAKGPRFETFDKIVAFLVFAFFIVTLGINYLTLYQYKGTADIDEIIAKTDLQKQIEKIEKQKPESQPEAPLAQ